MTRARRRTGGGGTWPAKPRPAPVRGDGESGAEFYDRQVKYLRGQGLHIVNGDRVERDQERPPRGHPGAAR